MTGPDLDDSNRSFYDRISTVYDLIADRSEHAARVAGEVALDVRPGERVFEIGVGTGHSLMSFARVTSIGSAVGSIIEASCGMAACASRGWDCDLNTVLVSGELAPR